MSLTQLLAALPEPLFSTYDLIRVLGIGAYAVVYEICHKATREGFALKVVEKEPMKVRLMLPQLQREVALLEVFDGVQHIVQLLEVIETSQHMFLRFELCEGSLEDLSTEQGPMQEQEAFRWLREACLGVQALHARGVVHRDIKPSNFLVDSDGSLRICDFGWACFEDQNLQGTCGTPEYSSPETQLPEAHGVAHTAKADIYGLGASLQHFLLGRVPMGPGDIPKGLSPDTRHLIRELTNPDPEARPTIEDLLWRPQLVDDNLFSQVWSKWHSIFSDITGTSHRQRPINDLSCGLTGIYS